MLKEGTKVNTQKKAPVNLKANEFQIRRAKYGDMPLIASFIESSADWYEKFVDKNDMPEHRPGQAWIEKNYFRREFYVGYEGNEPVGTISFQTVGDHAYLGYIYLNVRHVGKGFGKKLINHAKDLANQRNMKGMVLIAHPEASWATKAYVKYGFDKIASKKSEVLSWKKGVLKPYYEEGFELYRYDLTS